MQIKEPSDCAKQLDAVVSTQTPMLVEAVVDQFVAPMPPKVKPGQAAKFAEALMRGEPNRSKIVLTTAHERVRELV
jgi:pyruvate dehydrogenase (quinone)/pyruvate oxidase